ncbi:MAG: hypothetical protein IT367_05140 [Candidatus Hydrogenedentes bacterium]|nr:hypothetical protein [Candidatus Hydrogenedentota bacterium]
MNDINSQLRKAGMWLWNQKEKMFLAALLIVLCFRVYLVLSPAQASSKTSGSPTKAAAAAPNKMSPENVPDPGPRPVTERAEDFRPLVRQNPFTIWSIAATGKSASGSEEETIDVTLNNIVKWSDGAYRAELTTKVTGKSKRYKEGEVFENYKLMSIDPANKTVQIYSSAHDKTFELKMPGN